MTTIYHVTSAAAAKEAQESGEYVPERFAAEGFIHCSYLHQIEGVLKRHFPGRSGLVLLEIDVARLHCRIIDENLEGGSELFPHVYGKLPMSAVLHVYPVASDQQF
jgi:uncharacterized protein (DUF952 family)